MGFNISGVAINKNYENNLDELQNELGWKLKKQDDVIFETASVNWTESPNCYIYFCENGTLIFLDAGMCEDGFKLKDANTLSFILSEVSMTFLINYREKGELKRLIIESDDERFKDEGETLKVEPKSEDTSEIIWNQIEVVLGKPYWDIEPDENAVHYHLEELDDQNNSSTPTPQQAPVDSKKHDLQPQIQDEDKPKKWWEFWK